MPETDPRPLLSVRNLDVAIASRSILRDISFEIPTGGIVGLFGESGCGKTTLAFALSNLLPLERYRVSGYIEFEGRDIHRYSAREMQQIRGARIALVMQDPLLALNPVLRAGDQVAEAIRAHAKPSAPRIHEQVESAFGLAGLEPSSRIRNAYPHELSGGERQRVLLAQALACKPSVVIADEPFSALDAPSALALSALFREIRERLSTSFLLISHSPGILANAADYVLVMSAGQIVERGSPREVFERPRHPETATLLRAMDMAGRKR
jgi:ABC-type glutathione transport system ATPase component